MTTYERMLESLIEHFRANGLTRETMEAVRLQLPEVWASDLIFDALEAMA